VPALELWRGGGVPEGFGAEVEEPPARLESLTRFVSVRLDSGRWRAAPPANSGALHALAGTAGVAECDPDSDVPIVIHPWRCLV